MGWYADIKNFDIILRNVSEAEMFRRCVKAGFIDEEDEFKQSELIEVINDVLWPFAFEIDKFGHVELTDSLCDVDCKNPDRFLHSCLFDDGSLIELEDEFGYFCYLWEKGSVFRQNAEIVWHKDPLFLVSDGHGSPVAVFRERWGAENYLKEKLNYIGSCTEVTFIGNTTEVRDGTV